VPTRLVLRRLYPLAIRICEYLRLPEIQGVSRILAHWACYKARREGFVGGLCHAGAVLTAPLPSRCSRRTNLMRRWLMPSTRSWVTRRASPTLRLPPERTTAAGQSWPSRSVACPGGGGTEGWG